MTSVAGMHARVQFRTGRSGQETEAIIESVGLMGFYDLLTGQRRR